MLSAEQHDAAILAARAELWRRGELSFKLDPTQLALYELLKGIPGKQGVIEGARKLGKTYLFGCVALEIGIQNPGKQINWASGTAIDCRKILVPVLNEISDDAPPECKGEYNVQTGQWRLPNGAFIQIFGVETQKDCDRGRGPSTVANILDEAGFIDLLEYLLDSIFSPQLRRVKRQLGSFVGATLLCSTTPYTPAHPFCAIADAADKVGAYAKRTIYDSGFESPEDIESYIAGEAAKKGLSVEAFKATSTFKREYLSLRVVDTDAVVFPEFSTVAGTVVRTHQRPVGFEHYVHKRVAVDLGMSDKTGILYGYTDFPAAKVVVEDEMLLEKPNTSQIAQELKAHELALWGEKNASGRIEVDERRISRVIDDPQGRVVLDLWDLHRVRAEKATKHDREASIGLIRTWLANGTLVIDPRCIELRKQLLTATKNRSGKDFAHDDTGHFDLCAALMYFVRDLSLTTNPLPSDYDVVTGRALPDHHPIMARKEAMGEPRAVRGLAGQLLSGNKFVRNQLLRHRRFGT